MDVSDNQIAMPKLGEPEAQTGLENEALLSVLGEGAVQAICEKCNETEWVISLDLPIDAVFLANYRCDECEQDGI